MRLIRRALYGLMFRTGAKRTIQGMTVAIWWPTTTEERKLALERVGTALDLIEKFDPRALEELRARVRYIIVTGAPPYHACYIHGLRIVELYQNYVLSEHTIPEDLASTIVHEAQHVRLRRLGFGYDEPIRERIEKICFSAQRNFARRLPNGAVLIAEAQLKIEADFGHQLSNKSFRQRDLQTLRDLGLPESLVRALAWFFRYYRTLKQ